MNKYVRSLRSEYNDALKFHLRVSSLETRMTCFDTILPTLATKTDLKEVEGTLHTEVEKVRTEVEKVRTDLEKGQKENRTWLMTATTAIIGVMLAIATFFGSKQSPTAYAPQDTSFILASIIQELKELRERPVPNALDAPTD